MLTVQLTPTSSRACYIWNGTCDLAISRFIPIEDLAQKDADVALFYLSANGIRFTKAVDDDPYSAHQIDPHDKLPSNVYFADEPASALGCKIQYQTCDPNSDSATDQNCSPWGGSEEVNFLKTLPRSRKERIVKWGLQPGFTMTDVVDALSAPSLTSRFRMNRGIQAALPATNGRQKLRIGIVSV